VASIPNIVPDVAAEKDAQVFVGRPVRANTGSNFSDIENSTLLWRQLRMIQSSFLADDTIAEAPQSHAYRVRWVSSPGAQYVWLGMFTLATYPQAGSAAPIEIAARLRFTGGGVIDGPVYWRYTPGAPGHGRIPLSPAVLVASRAFLPKFTQTGWDLPLDPAYTGPRLLDLGANQATDVEVTLSTLECRLYSCTVIEAFRAEVP